MNKDTIYSKKMKQNIMDIASINKLNDITLVLALTHFILKHKI